jgi:hypothetical protein
VTVTDRTEPVAVDTVVTGQWIITLNATREIYRDGTIAVSGGVITEVGTDAENVSNHTDICRAMQLAALLPRDCVARSRRSTAASWARSGSPRYPAGPSSDR